MTVLTVKREVWYFKPETRLFIGKILQSDKTEIIVVGKNLCGWKKILGFAVSDYRRPRETSKKENWNNSCWYKCLWMEENSRICRKKLQKKKTADRRIRTRSRFFPHEKLSIRLFHRTVILHPSRSSGFMLTILKIGLLITLNFQSSSFCGDKRYFLWQQQIGMLITFCVTS